MIESYSFGSITIDGKSYRSDLIIYPDYIDDTWWRVEGHKLCLKDIDSALEASPETLVIGCGASNILKISAEVKRELGSRGIELIAADTAEACQAHNRLADKKRVVTCLHLTC